MRRISLALALLGAVAATGCSGGNKASSTSSGTQKGVPGQYFYVNLFSTPVGGIITSNVGGINCGASAVTVNNAVNPPQYVYTPYPGTSPCGQTQFAWGSTVVLTASPQGGNAFIGWAGDCSGVGTCTLTDGPDKSVVAIFGAPGSGHTNFLDPATHGPAATSGALDCARCHGANLQGQGIAPGCNTCHAIPGITASKKSGLVATITGVTAAGASAPYAAPIAVTFTLKDAAGKNVDVTGVGFGGAGDSGKNQPMAVTMSINQFGTDANGNLLPYKGLVTGFSPSATTSGAAITSNAYQAGVLCTAAAPCTPTAANPVFKLTTSGTSTSGTSGATTGLGTTCTVAAPCTCSAANPCMPVSRVVAGNQGATACTQFAECACTAQNSCTNQNPSTVTAASTTNTGTATSGFQGGRACTVASPCTCTAQSVCSNTTLTAAANGTLSYASGVYTYTFPSTYAYQAASIGNTHAIWLQAVRQENLTAAYDATMFTAQNKDFAFVAATGAAAPRREIVSEAACAKCHNGFPAEANSTGTGWGGFHSGARIAGPYCAICHYDGRGTPGTAYQVVGPDTVGGAADSKVFIHRIHGAEQLGLPAAQWFHAIGATYPQAVANCDECHTPAANGAQYMTHPTRVGCGSCHYTTSFTSPAPAGSTLHSGGAWADDSACFTCHGPAAPFPVANYHVPVLPLDPCNTLSFAADNTACLATGATAANSRTNAGAIAAAGKKPASAARIDYVVDSVGVVLDGAVYRPWIKFKLTKNGADVVFNTAPAAPATWVTDELMTGFTGTTTAYFAWAVPQDGIAAPADFNVTASGNIKQIWWGKSSGTSAGTMTGPDAGGFYTLTLTGVQVASNANLLTGGIGYAYDLPSNQPLTQTDLAGYPTADVNITSGTVLGVTCTAANPCVVKSGGLIVPVQNKWKAATGGSWVARRPIVNNGKCLDCHGFLGVEPSFHVGQRNDGPTCSFCHNPNRTSSGWSANAATMIHGIHYTAKRSVPFNWHAACPTGSGFVAGTNAVYAANGDCRVGGVASGNVVAPDPFFGATEYPGNSCTQCHEAGTYDFSAAASAAAVPNLLWSTVGTGSYTAGISNSPYVALGTAYGAGFSYAANTGVATAAAGTTLVSSPLAAACFSCHDTDAARLHIEAGGGSIYAPRSTAFSKAENCLNCHGPLKPWAIDAMH